MKVMISQPMKGKTEKQIRDERAPLINKLHEEGHIVIDTVLDISEKDRMLSFLPLHHVFECTVGFLMALYKGMQVSFCDGIKHIVENMNEYKITYMACVPAIYENIYKNILKKLQKQGKLEEINQKIIECKKLSMEEKKETFQEIHNMLGGHVRLLISGAAALNNKVEQGYRDFGINLVQGYGLTETSPVIGIGNKRYYKVGSIGKAIPQVEAKIEDANIEGIGEKRRTLLLKKYKSLTKLKELSVEELESILPKDVAFNLHEYLKEL